MTNQVRQSTTAGPLRVASRVGLGLGGAVIGMIAALHAFEAGFAFFRSPEFMIVLALAGGVAAYLGAGIEPPAKKADSAALLSAIGTLLVGSSAVLAAWLLFFRAPAQGVWGMMLASCWLFGVTAQVCAGLLARLRVVDPDIA